jgi:Protein of unknown function (DUF3575)
LIKTRRFNFSFAPISIIQLLNFFMKKLLLPIFLAVFACIQTANAQIDLTVRPLNLLTGGFGAGVDFALSDNFSIELAPVFRSYGKVNSGKFRAIGGFLVPKFYVAPVRGADGFYVDLFIRAINRKTTFADSSVVSDYAQTRIGAGVGIGYKFAFKNNFVFEAGAGGGSAFYDKIKYETNGTQNAVSWTKVMLQFKLAIGYRFGGGKSDKMSSKSSGSKSKGKSAPPKKKH